MLKIRINTYYRICIFFFSFIFITTGCTYKELNDSSIQKETPEQEHPKLDNRTEVVSNANVHNDPDNATEKVEIVDLIFAQNQITTVLPSSVLELQLYVQLKDGDMMDIQALGAWDEINLSTDQDWAVIDANGKLNILAHAPVGSEAVITASYKNISTQTKVIVLYSLEDTIDVFADADLPIVTNASSIAVIVNKQRSLPQDYVPEDLVIPDVSFFFEEDDQKKYLRKPAADALEQLFEAAKEEGIDLVAVSGYRSYERQKAIFEANIKWQGEEQARRFSAMPGTSEHQTGLAMDVSSREFGNRLEQDFGDTEAGKWIAENCHQYGFIIRYPEGKEDITGYAYEPWHLRYVGKPLAMSITESGLTLEEYFSQSIPVSTEESDF